MFSKHKEQRWMFLTSLLTWVPSWLSCSPQTWWSSPPPGPAWHPSHQQPSVRRSWPLPSWAGCRPLLSSVPTLTAPCPHTTEGSGRQKTSQVIFELKRPRIKDIKRIISIKKHRGEMNARQTTWLHSATTWKCITTDRYVLHSKHIFKSYLSSLTVWFCLKTEAAC